MPGKSGIKCVKKWNGWTNGRTNGRTKNEKKEGLKHPISAEI